MTVFGAGDAGGAAGFWLFTTTSSKGATCAFDPNHVKGFNVFSPTPRSNDKRNPPRLRRVLRLTMTILLGECED
jgi:hypothetical protein